MSVSTEGSRSTVPTAIRAPAVISHEQILLTGIAAKFADRPSESPSSTITAPSDTQMRTYWCSG